MTTYTTPNASPGLVDRGMRSAPGNEQINSGAARDLRDLRDLRDPTPGQRREPSLAARGPVDVAGVRTADWSPGGTRGVPKAAIGVVGAALVGGVALAVVLIGPGDKVVKPASPAVAMAPAARSPASAATADTTVDNAVAQMDQQPTAAGPAATTAPADTSAQGDASTQATPAAAKATKADRSAPAPHATAHRSAPTGPVADDRPAAAPSADAQQPSSQAPAMQQTPAAPTMTPDTPPAPAPDQGATPTPAPAPGQDGQ